MNKLIIFKKKLIFYQSTLEILNILKIITNDPDSKFLIIVTGGKNLFQILCKLKFEEKFGAKIYEFHAHKLINPINVFRTFFRLHYSKQVKEILSINYQEVFFFNYSWDFVTPFFLSKLKTKKLFYINFYNEKLRKIKMNFKQYAQYCICKILFKNANIKIVAHEGPFRTFFFFPLKKNIYNKKSIKKIPKVIFELPNLSKINKINILYLDSGEESYKYDGFKKILSEIFSIIDTAKYNVIIKKHPIVKLSSFFSNFKNFNYILDPLPVELYNLKNVKYVFGIVSTGLSQVANNYSNIKVFSIIKLLSSQKLIQKRQLDLFKEYLYEMTKKNQIYYPESLKEFKKLVKF